MPCVRARHRPEICWPGRPYPAGRQTLISLRGGRVVALREGAEMRFLKPLTREQESAMREALQLAGNFRSQALTYAAQTFEAR